MTAADRTPSAFPRLRRVACALVAAAALTAAACGSSDERPQLHVFTWSEYLDPSILRAFEAEAGCVVTESVFDSNEALRAKLQTGGAAFDVVCPSDYMVTQLISDGLLERLDHANLPNLVHLDPEFRDPAYDPGLAHSVPFQWGVTGIGFDRTKAEPAPTSWKDLFDPARNERFRGRIGLLDDAREGIGAALLSLGKDPNSTDPADLDAAAERLLALKPHVQNFDSSDFGSTLAAGQTVAVQGWSGTFAQSAKDAPQIGFVVPEEGGFRYVDNWAVPKGARQKALAERFIDHLLRPEVAADLVRSKGYASPNAAANRLLDDAVRSGMAYAGRGSRLHAVKVLPAAAAQRYADVWKAFKSE